MTYQGDGRTVVDGRAELLALVGKWWDDAVVVMQADPTTRGAVVYVHIYKPIRDDQGRFNVSVKIGAGYDR